MKSNVRAYTAAALFAALTAVMSQLIIPMTPVPLSMSLAAVFLAAGLLGGSYGTVSQLVYVAMGAFGLPVFSGLSSTATLIGPTGGFIVGYVFCALISGILIGKSKSVSFVRICLSLASGLAVCHVFGIVWYCLFTKTGIFEAFTVCSMPFLAGDALKFVLSATVIKKLRPRLGKSGII